MPVAAFPDTFEVLPVVEPLINNVVHHNLSFRKQPIREVLRDFRDGIVDFALLPPYTIASLHEQVSIIPEAAVASERNGALLFFNKEQHDLATVAYDPRFQQDMILARIILAEVFNAAPDFREYVADIASVLQKFDGDIVSGVEAVRSRDYSPNRFDLYAEWKNHTDLIWVNYVWVARSGIWEPAQLAPFSAAAGLVKNDSLPVLSPENETDLAVKEHIRANVRFILDEEMLESIRALHELMFYHNLGDQIPDINLFEKA